MLPITIKLLEDNLRELEKRIDQLEREEAFVGVSEAQGQHYSGMTYPELGILHANGSTELNIPSRDIAEWSLLTYKGHRKLKADMKQFLQNLDKKPTITAKRVAGNWAKDFHDHSLTIFGNTSYLESNSQYTQTLKSADGVNPPNNPLVWTGDYKDAWSAWINDIKVN